MRATSEETLKALASKNVELSPLDLSKKYGEAAVARFKADIEKELRDDPSSTTFLDKAIENLDSKFGINFKGALQDAWEKFSDTFPDAANKLAQFLLETVGGEDYARIVKENPFAALLSYASQLKLGMPDVTLPRGVVENALNAVWDDIQKALGPEASEALAKAILVACTRFG